jgi:hypothetical protein
LKGREEVFDYNIACKAREAIPPAAITAKTKWRDRVAATDFRALSMNRAASPAGAEKDEEGTVLKKLLTTGHRAADHKSFWSQKS